MCWHVQAVVCSFFMVLPHSGSVIVVGRGSTSHICLARIGLPGSHLPPVQLGYRCVLLPHCAHLPHGASCCDHRQWRTITRTYTLFIFRQLGGCCLEGSTMHKHL